MDFQSIALPTELYPQLSVFTLVHYCFTKARAKVTTSYLFTILRGYFFSLLIFATMQHAPIVYVIDSGNSSIKVARFENDQLSELVRFTFLELDALAQFVTNPVAPCVLSSVLSEEDTEQLAKKLNAVTRIQSNTPVPLSNNYTSINTLGMDRLCNAVYLHNHMESAYAVAIDIGTCIKFDLVGKKEGYIGGSIAPGINLRFKSLNDYTGKLPLLSNKTSLDFVGTDTETSIRSGVINGIKAEIEGIMEQYRLRYSDLTFFMSGGDAKNFDFLAKNDIFADENLTLMGLYEIYQNNA
jgi:type III pantothenate kinase